MVVTFRGGHAGAGSGLERRLSDHEKVLKSQTFGRYCFPRPSCKISSITKGQPAHLAPEEFTGLGVETGLVFVDDYSWWRRMHFSEEDRHNDSISGPSADFSEKGVTNLERFVLGLGPDDLPDRIRAEMTMVLDNGVRTPVVTFERARLAADLPLVLQTSDNLADWEEIPGETLEVAPFGDGMERLTILPGTDQVSTEHRAFYRFLISEDDL